MITPMTDEDRYARKLGKAFEGVRATLCSPETQDEAPARAARYIVSQLAKDIDVKALFRRTATAIDSKNSFFEDTETLAVIERAASETLGAEHFAESMRDVLDRGEQSDRLLEHLARRGVDGTRDSIILERAYRTDTDCQAAFARHDRGIYDEVVAQLRLRCGLEAMPTAAAVPRNQVTILEFVVARDE
jgi:hypothetical protein